VGVLLVLAPDDAADHEGRTPLSYAVRHADAVALLLSTKAHVGSLDRCRRSPLMYAAQHGCMSTIGQLVAAKADVNAGDMYCSTALGRATSQGHDAAVLLLLDAKASASTRGCNPLAYAVHRGVTETVSALLEAKADVCGVDDLRRPLVRVAAKKGYSSLVELLVSAKADVDAESPRYRPASNIMPVLRGEDLAAALAANAAFRAEQAAANAAAVVKARERRAKFRPHKRS
jgi:ankyrin repeat protein